MLKQKTLPNPIAALLSSMGSDFFTSTLVSPDSVNDLLKAIHSQYTQSSFQSQYGTSKSYPLHLAAALGDIATLTHLLKTGASIEQRDDLHLTPLQVAAVSGQAEAVSFLIAKGANVFAVNGYKLNLNALDLAIMESQAGVVEVLITQGHVLDNADVFELAYLYNVAFGILWALASYCEEMRSTQHFKDALETFITIVNTRDFPLLEFPMTDKKDKKNIQDIIGMPAAVLLEVLASQVTNKMNYNRIMDEIDKINEKDSSYQTYLDAKALFHVLPVHGNYPITYRKADNTLYLSKITAEGHWGSFTTPMASEVIDAYLHDKLAFEDSNFIHIAFESIHKIYEYAVLYSKETAIFDHAQEAYDLYQQGQTVLLPTGWDGHFVNIILDPSHEYFIVANCGMRFQGLPGGANIYKMYNPNGLTPNLIYNILNNTEQVNLELVFKYQLALDKVEGLWQPDQIHGNCAWQSHEPAIEALLYISFLDQGYSNKEAIFFAHEQYIKWDAYQTLLHLETYFNEDPALGVEALKDILVENHPSLFLAKNKQADLGVNPTEYEQAKYIVSILTQDLYKKEVVSVFSEVLKKAKPELLGLFKTAGFNMKTTDKLGISDILLDGSEGEGDWLDNPEVIEIDSLFRSDWTPVFPGIEFVLKKTSFLGTEFDSLSDWC